MTRRSRQFLLLTTILLGAYLIYVAIMTWQQDHIVFAGQGIPMTIDLRETHTMASYVKLETSFGETFACYLESEGELNDCPIAIVAHGNAETIGHWGEIAKHFHQLGLSLLLVEYPGYGGSDGKPSNTTIGETLDAAHAWLDSNRGLSRRKLIGIGNAFGSGPILELAERKPIDGLILLAPYSSLAKLTHSMGLPAFLLRTKYNNVGSIKALSRPTLILHGSRDRIIPPAHSAALAEASNRVTRHLVDSAHKELWADPEPLIAHIDAWLDSHKLTSE